MSKWLPPITPRDRDAFMTEAMTTRTTPAIGGGMSKLLMTLAVLYLGCGGLASTQSEAQSEPSSDDSLCAARAALAGQNFPQSITKRYFTSPATVRSNASLMRLGVVISMSLVMPCFAQ